MFAGIGGFRSGMEEAGHRCVGFIEWDKYARKSYQAMYDTEGEYNAKNIQTVSGTDLPDADVWCFGSPCQSVSLAGKRAGLKEGTRSGLFLEVIRLLKERIKNKKTIPSYLLIENVKGLLSSTGGWDFARVQIEVDEAGYDVEWNVFNSAEVVPQNRERIYIVGHLRGGGTRKVFPIQRQSGHSSEKQSIKVVGNTSKTGYRSHDSLDENGISKTLTASEGVKVNTLVALHNTVKQGGTIDAKQQKINVIGNYGTDPTNHISERTRVFINGKAPTLQASDYKQPKAIAINQVGNILNTKSFGGNPQTGRVYDTNGISPTLNTMQGGGREPKILIKNNTKLGYLEAHNGDGVDLSYPTSNNRRGRVQKKRSNTLETSSNLGVVVGKENLRIRKLTPLECWRLQGFSDEQFYKAKQSGVSNTQLYKQSGNAVTIPVVKAIAERLVISG